MQKWVDLSPKSFWTNNHSPLSVSFYFARKAYSSNPVTIKHLHQDQSAILIGKKVKKSPFYRFPLESFTAQE
jgi:hypothetical protein